MEAALKEAFDSFPETMREMASEEILKVDIDVQRLTSVLTEAARESDRASVILIFGYIDDVLAAMFRRNLNDEIRNGVEGLLKQGGLLDTASNRINMAASLWWISKGTYEELNLIRKIRNEFAHRFEVSKFEHDPICGYVASMPKIENKLNKVIESHGLSMGAITSRHRALIRMYQTVGDLVCESVASPIGRNFGVTDGSLLDDKDKLPKNLLAVRTVIASQTLRLLAQDGLLIGPNGPIKLGDPQL